MIPIFVSKKKFHKMEIRLPEPKTIEVIRKEGTHRVTEIIKTTLASEKTPKRMDLTEIDFAPKFIRYLVSEIPIVLRDKIKTDYSNLQDQQKVFKYMIKKNFSREEEQEVLKLMIRFHLDEPSIPFRIDHLLQNHIYPINILENIIIPGIKMSDPFWGEVMYQALKSDAHNAIAYLLYRGFDPNRLIDSERYTPSDIIKEQLTPLIIALEFNRDPSLIRTFIEYGADVNLKVNSENPLGAAIKELNIPNLQILLESGAIPTGKDLITALHIDHFDRDYGREMRYNIVERLIESGVDVNYVSILPQRRDSCPYTIESDAYTFICGTPALFFAIREYDYALVKLLLDSGADETINVIGVAPRIRQICPALRLSVEQLDVFKLLIDHGADPFIIFDYTDSHGREYTYNLFTFLKRYTNRSKYIDYLRENFDDYDARREAMGDE